MRRPLSVIGASAVALLAIAALVVWPIPSKAAENCAPAPGHTADAKVILKDRQFQPASVTLSTSGMSVCWEHQDPGIGHTITSDAATNAPDYFRFPKDTPPCDNEADADCFNFEDQPWKLMLNSPGTYKYHCELHPSTMRGTIVVQGGGGGTTATTRAAAATTTTAAGATGTTIGTLAQETTTTLDPSASSTSSSSSSTTSSSIDFTTQTTSPEIAQSGVSNDDDDEASGVLKAVGTVLLLAVIAALIPSWRRLT